jgi:hypothetical protein
MDSDGKETMQSTCFRRFSDFTWLHTQLQVCQVVVVWCIYLLLLLQTKFKGLLIPPLPDKVMGRFSTEFVAERKRGLMLFLERIAGGAQALHHVVTLFQLQSIRTYAMLRRLNCS